MIHAINPIDAKKETDVHNNKKLILGIKDGSTYIFKPSKNKNFYIYNDDMLAYKSDVKVIKEYTAQQVECGQLDKYIKSQVGRAEVIQESLNAGDGRYNSCIAKDVELWENNQVVFCFDSDFLVEEQQLIYQAISQWANRTNMRFRIASIDNVSSFKYITKIIYVDNECSASLGRPEEYKPGSLSFDFSCDLQSIIHNIGHTVGLIHEHQRPKRDDYLTIREDVLDTIREAFDERICNIVRANINKLSVYNDDPPFDYNSMMIYDSYSASGFMSRYMKKRKMPLYTKKNGKFVTRPNEGITSIDAMKVNLAYPAFNP